jgi:hypothetical protein
MSGDWRETLWTLLVTSCVVIIRCTETFWSLRRWHIIRSVSGSRMMSHRGIIIDCDVKRVSVSDHRRCLLMEWPLRALWRKFHRIIQRYWVGAVRLMCGVEEMPRPDIKRRTAVTRVVYGISRCTRGRAEVLTGFWQGREPEGQRPFRRPV